MDKEKQVAEFVSKLRSGIEIKYSFSMDMEWYSYHGRYEELNNDWIEAGTEKLIDGDSGRAFYEFTWKYNIEEDSFECYVESDIDEKEVAKILESEEVNEFF